MRIILLSICLFLGLSPTYAADKISDLDRFKLWNRCKPVRLLVESMKEDAQDIGLTKEMVEVAVRSRLRGAKLYDAKTLHYLYVNVNVVSNAFSLDLELTKVVYDSVSRQSSYAATWGIGSAGIHERTGADFILSAVAQKTDWFIDEYLRVNADACG